ncbi:outer membrane protein assembly factor BamB [Bacterioplanes sanyensis]|uniref:Outer membrane protein assembly factor BamB n=1 Tax=Bacterioplanes sanyensis TaxID=1249553 RepID=A0A222FKF1_9GAMM|nr:outer membrane protein assembly factor BamB [Bacterioplanes sanyensis]ASP39229.1 outer membrane protein assembly factor BamB [Bacterioplanes sanyensis]
MPRLFCALLLSLAVAGCSSTPEQPQSSLSSIDDQLDVDVEWRLNLGQQAGTRLNRLRPAVQNDTVFMASADGRVLALELASGAEQWQLTLEQNIIGGVALAGDQLFVSTMDGMLHSISTAGELQWSSALASEAVASVASDAQRVFVHTIDGRLSAYQRDNGEQLWTYEHAMPVLSVRGTSSPLVLEQLVVTGFASGKVVALDKRLGIPRWDVRLAIPDGRSELERLVDVDGTPVWDNGVIYAASYHGKVAALSPRGEVRWQEDGSSYGHPVLALGSLYLSLDDGTLQAYDIYNGANQWTQTILQGKALGQVTVFDRYLAVADDEGFLYLLSLVDGELLARERMRPKPLHKNVPNSPEMTNWRGLRGRDFGLSAPMVATERGLLVTSNTGELLLLTVHADQ